MPTEPIAVRHEAHYLRYLMAALLIVFAVLLVVLVFQYRALRRAETISGHASFRAFLIKHHVPLSSGDTGVIQSWMTFDYVDHLFGLPSSTLKEALQITNTHYPHLTMQSYAGDDVNAANVISEVQDAIRAYDAASSTNSATATSTSAIQ